MKIKESLIERNKLLIETYLYNLKQQELKRVELINGPVGVI